MREFILDSNPKFGEAKVTIEKTTYELKMIKQPEGGVFTVDDNDHAKDQIFVSKKDMRAFFLLLSARAKEGNPD